MQIVIIVACTVISIHALLAESDAVGAPEGADTGDISIHALLAESDADCPSMTVLHCNFYPRSPCGERRLWVLMGGSNYEYFYPRSPCGERPNRCTTVPNFRYFYPRSPCGERLGRVAVV